MSARTHHRLRVVQFLRDYQFTFKCSLGRAINAVLTQDTMASGEVLRAAKYGNQSKDPTSLPSQASLYRWYKRYFPNTHPSQPVNDSNPSSALIDRLRPLLSLSDLKEVKNQLVMLIDELDPPELLDD